MTGYIIVGIILLFIVILYMKLADRWGIVDIPHHQSSHTGTVVRGGGVIFYFAFLLWSLFHGFLWYGVLIGLTVLVIVSLVDDIRGVSPRVRLLSQFIAFLILFYHTGLIQMPCYVILILSIACVGAVNIYNFMDGINGMTGGYSLIVVLALLYVNHYCVYFVDVSLLACMILSILIFNFFNFRKNAICFAGDVGAVSIGYIIVYLVLRLALKGHSMSWIVMLSVYLVDSGMTILHRILLRENLIKPHKKHTYQIMVNELKMPHLIVSGIYMGLQAISCTIYIIWPGYPSFFAIFGMLTFLYLAFMKKYYHLHVRKES